MEIQNAVCSGPPEDAQSRHNVVSLLPDLVPFKDKGNKHMCVSSWQMPKHLTHSYLLATACLPPGMQLSPLKSNEILPQQIFSKVQSYTHPSSLISSSIWSQALKSCFLGVCWIACHVSKVGIHSNMLSEFCWFC